MSTPTDTLDPARPAAYAARWGLLPEGPGFATYSSQLLPVRLDGQAAMLKVARSDEERRGNALMAWWGGRGAAQVLRHDDAAVVLERACGPRSLASDASDAAGSPLWAQADARATRVLCSVARELHEGPQPGPGTVDLVPLERWFRDLLARGETHRGFFRRAATTARALLAEHRPPTALHGDIHHGNVLDFGDDAAPVWKAIDPKGLVGDRAFDLANIVCNPSSEIATLPGRLERQVTVISAATDLDAERVLRWVVAWAGLSAAWFSEAEPGWMSAATRGASADGVLTVGRAAEDLLR